MKIKLFACFVLSLPFSFIYILVYLQSVTKIMGKNCYLANFVFLPLPTLNNVEKQYAKVVSKCVIGWQHCIGGDREF